MFPFIIEKYCTILLYKFESLRMLETIDLVNRIKRAGIYLIKINFDMLFTELCIMIYR